MHACIKCPVLLPPKMERKREKLKRGNFLDSCQQLCPRFQVLLFSVNILHVLSCLRIQFHQSRSCLRFRAYYVKGGMPMSEFVSVHCTFALIYIDYALCLVWKTKMRYVLRPSIFEWPHHICIPHSQQIN